MIIDAHAHVYADPRIRRSPDATPFMSAGQQIAMMDAKGIDRAVILPIAGTIAYTEGQSIGEILGICAEYPGRFIPFCNMDPRIWKRPEHITATDFIYLLEQYRDLGCKGLGEVVTRVFFDDPAMLALFGACEKVGFPVTFHTTTPETDSYRRPKLAYDRVRRTFREASGLL